MVIFSIAIGGSGTKSLPLLLFDVRIMKVKRFLPVSSLEDEVVAVIIEFEKLVVKGFFVCKMLKRERRR